MPGPVSDSSRGPQDESPYVPSYCFKNGPRFCPCGHHEGFHDDRGACLLKHRCKCSGLPASRRTPLGET